MNFDNGLMKIRRVSYYELPQGSCLSPLLYNFYVNNIDTCLAPGCSLRQLADDGVVSVTSNNIADLQSPLQTTLNNLEMWATNLAIEFSPEKTDMLIFSFFYNT